MIIGAKMSEVNLAAARRVIARLKAVRLGKHDPISTDKETHFPNAEMPGHPYTAAIIGFVAALGQVDGAVDHLLTQNARSKRQPIEVARERGRVWDNARNGNDLPRIFQIEPMVAAYVGYALEIETPWQECAVALGKLAGLPQDESGLIMLGQHLSDFYFRVGEATIPHFQADYALRGLRREEVYLHGPLALKYLNEGHPETRITALSFSRVEAPQVKHFNGSSPYTFIDCADKLRLARKWRATWVPTLVAPGEANQLPAMFKTVTDLVPDFEQEMFEIQLDRDSVVAVPFDRIGGVALTNLPLPNVSVLME